jgi:RecB family endonuclease NucS
MGKFKVWQVGEVIPLKLAESNVGLEKNLEGWIEADPSLLLGELEIICRQMTVEGSRLDLLAIDPLGRCVVIEVKAGPLYSDVISQGIYYAAQIDRYSFETLESKVHYYLNKHNKDL